MKVMLAAAWWGFCFGLLVFLACWFLGVPVDRARSYGVTAWVIFGILVIALNIGIFFHGVNQDRKKRNKFKQELKALDLEDVRTELERLRSTDLKERRDV